jgi:hypothetical protein
MSSTKSFIKNRMKQEDVMNKSLSLILSLALAAMLIALSADQTQAQTTGKQLGKSAMSHYGPFDDDGDGIPNGQDPDYVRPQDGSGHKFGKMNGAGKMFGKSNGQGIGQRSRTCFGTGVCDGAGPKGRGK